MQLERLLNSWIAKWAIKISVLKTTRRAYESYQHVMTSVWSIIHPSERIQLCQKPRKGKCGGNFPLPNVEILWGWEKAGKQNINAQKYTLCVPENARCCPKLLFEKHVFQSVPGLHLGISNRTTRISKKALTKSREWELNKSIREAKHNLLHWSGYIVQGWTWSARKRTVSFH